MENLFEKGCLVQLSASVWGATRKIHPHQITDLPVSGEWLRASKKLVDPEALKPINKIINKARSYLTATSLPFPIKGMEFVPKEMISRVDERLNGFKTEFNHSVETFMESYDRLREVAMVHLGELFNETEYPLDVRKKFAFIWRFVILDVPNGNAALLAPEVYEREKEKFVQTMEQARELAVQSLREEFAGMVERITDRFSHGPNGDVKVFKNGTVNHFYEYFETFKERNIFKDDALSELVERAKVILGGKSAEEIRSNDRFKDRIREGMQDVEKAMAEILSMPRRRIIMN
jgi:hypothetical protein